MRRRVDVFRAGRPCPGHEVVMVFTVLGTNSRKHGFDVAGGLLVYGRHIDHGRRPAVRPHRR
jgi:hypothetical protein